MFFNVPNKLKKVFVKNQYIIVFGLKVKVLSKFLGCVSESFIFFNIIRQRIKNIHDEKKKHIRAYLIMTWLYF